MLVLKEFKIDGKAETFLSIKGRQEGIISWFLSIVGIDPTVELICNRQEIMFRCSSIRKGQVNINIPNTAVTAVVTGYEKPFRALVMAAACILFGLIQSLVSIWLLVIGLVLGAILIVYYILNKKMIFGVYNGGDSFMAALATKRSVIEGVPVDFDKFEKAATLLNKAILARSAR